MPNGAEDSYPRILNGDGCLYGRHLQLQVNEVKEDYEERMHQVEKKLDRLTWAAVGVMISLMTTSLTLWITHLAP
mgnify:CR=1 FL=1